MGKLKIEALKINVHTSRGLFGTSISFSDGLNILRAKNSTGKSSCINAILYALGMEELLGGVNGKTMKPVLREEVFFEDKKYDVLESNVILQISSQSGNSITITRWITSSTKDERLVEVQFGPYLTEHMVYEAKDYYVHLPGSAVNKAGFHTFLSDFIGWKLPNVPTFDGKDRLLYIQILFPLFFIEQIKGWSSFYAQPLTNYGIRDISTRALEFILGLDVLENSRKKEELKIEQTVLIKEWRSISELMINKVNSIGGVVQNLSEKPDLLSKHHIFVYNDSQELVSLSSRIIELKEKNYSKRNIIRSIKEVEKEHEAKVSKVEENVLVLQNEANIVRREINSEQLNKEALEYNILQLKNDLKANQDAQRLYKLGSEKKSSVAKGMCPTCNQKINDTLLPQDIDIRPMTIEENISYIKDQLNVLEFGVIQSRNIITLKEKKLRALERSLKEERKKLRMIKSELREDPRLLSETDIEELLKRKWEIKELESVAEEIEHLETQLEEIRSRWEEYLKEKDKLPTEFFSESDKLKLKKFEESFVDYLKEFGFSSTPLTDISISLDKYTPVVKGLDVKFDSSASDYIRLIWAFTLALENVTVKISGNHPKLIVMDEPGQQQMDVKNIGSLFKALAGLGGQSVIATSLTNKEISELTNGLTANVVDLGDEYIIKLQ